MSDPFAGNHLDVIVPMTEAQVIESLKQQLEAMRENAHALAMQALQSERYQQDPDYRDAVDNVLAHTMPVRRK